MSFEFFTIRHTEHVKGHIKKEVSRHGASLLPQKDLDKLVQEMFDAEKHTLSYKVLEHQDVIDSSINLVIPKRLTFNIKPSVLLNGLVKVIASLIDRWNSDDSKVFTENIKTYVHNQINDFRFPLLQVLKKIKHEGDKKVIITLYNDINKARRIFYERETTPETLKDDVMILRDTCFNAVNSARQHLSQPNRRLLDRFIAKLHEFFFIITGVITQRSAPLIMENELKKVEEFASFKCM